MARSFADVVQVIGEDAAKGKSGFAPGIGMR
jgi:hypothetical protein